MVREMLHNSRRGVVYIIRRVWVELDVETCTIINCMLSVQVVVEERVVVTLRIIFGTILIL